MQMQAIRRARHVCSKSIPNNNAQRVGPGTMPIPTMHACYRSICEPALNICLNTTIFNHDTILMRRLGTDTNTKAGNEASPFTTQWDTMFQQLKDYKLEHGDTFVPTTYPDNPSLGYWVDNNRQAYRMRLEYEKNCPDGDTRNPNSHLRKFIMMMTDEKIEALESIGFVWNVPEHIWNTRYEELLKYIEKHGNALVPHIYLENESLGLWVHKQRRNYKAYKQQLGGNVSSDSETSLSPERIQKLNDVNFIWDVHEASFLERLEELKKYRRDHGDSLVPKEYGSLYKWVEKQRADYKKYMAKKRLDQDESLLQRLDESEIQTIRKYQTAMNEERIQLLDAEDFIMDPLEYTWQIKYDELCEWIALNGHGAIRRGGKNYSPLEGWAESQRRLYKKYLNGEKTSLTEERIEKLSKAGFVFHVEKGNVRAKSTNVKKKHAAAATN